MLVLQGANRPQGRHLGHAPGVQHFNPIHVVECRDHGGWTSRTADDRALEGTEAQATGLHVAQHHLPHGGHAGSKGHTLRFDQLEDRFAIHGRPRKHQFGARHGRGIRQAPGVDVEHRHHWQYGVAGAHAQGVRQRTGQGVKHGGAVAVQRGLGIARGAAGVAHTRGGVFVK